MPLDPPITSFVLYVITAFLMFCITWILYQQFYNRPPHKDKYDNIKQNIIQDSGDAAQNEVSKKRVAVADEAKQLTKDAVEGFIQNEAKRKDDDYTSGNVNAKTTLTFPKSENAENDLQKATNEVIHLREEESKLRHENLRLKEELLRLHQMVGGEGRAARRHSYGPEKAGTVSLMPWVAAAVAMALLGILIGKFLM